MNVIGYDEILIHPWYQPDCVPCNFFFQLGAWPYHLHGLIIILHSAQSLESSVFVIVTTSSNQFVVGTKFAYYASLNKVTVKRWVPLRRSLNYTGNAHPIRVMNRWQPMCDGNCGPACSCFIQGFLYNSLWIWVESWGRLRMVLQWVLARNSCVEHWLHQARGPWDSEWVLEQSQCALIDRQAGYINRVTWRTLLTTWQLRAFATHIRFETTAAVFDQRSKKIEVITYSGRDLIKSRMLASRQAPSSSSCVTSEIGFVAPRSTLKRIVPAYRVW